MYFRTTLLLLPLLSFVSAICPGYNYAFWNGGGGWFYTSNDACSIVVSGLCDNPCECHAWGCGPSHSVNAALVNGLWYACRNDAGKGSCGSGGSTSPQIAHKAPESCCRNDGNRNLREGRIKARQALAIEGTNTVLDRHLEEYEQAQERGEDLDVLRRRQMVEVEEAMKREEEAVVLDSE